MPVVDIRAARAAVQETLSSKLFFPVRIMPLIGTNHVDTFIGPFMQMVTGIPNTNEDNQELILGVHGPVYKLVENEAAFRSVDEAIIQSNINCTEMAFIDVLLNGGRQAIRTYTFPAVKQTIIPNTVVELELRVVNSYDGTLKFGYIASAILQGQKIGMTFRQGRMQSFGKHTTNINVNSIIRRLNIVVEQFNYETNIWKNFCNCICSEYSFLDLISSMSQINDLLKETLTVKFRRNAILNGGTLWCAYLTLCHWTNDQRSIASAYVNNKEGIRLNREKQIRQVFNSQQWKQLSVFPSE